MWSHEHIKRIILDLSLKVTGQPFTGDASFYEVRDANWKDTLGLDSIELMGLAAAVNSFFNVFEVDNAPYLLSSTRVDDWVSMVFDARQRRDDSLSFNTSGTSGKTKIIKHSLSCLQREIKFLASVFNDTTCIIPYVPSYTIYGFLLTVGLPQVLDVPLLYPSAVNWQKLPAGSLIVATPFNWQLLADSLPGIKVNCFGVSAAATLYNGLYQQVISKGIKLTELYGATETSGIAWRQSWQLPFELFPYWQFTDDLQVEDNQSGSVFTLMDDITRNGNDTFTITGRKDKQVKIAGKLVDLASVARSVETIANVKQCNISAKATGSEVIIQAEIALYSDGETQRADIRSEIRKLLSPHEKPRDIYFVA